MTKRKSVPSAIQHEIRTEAGYRCAIPTCRHPKIEIAHIVPWSKTQDNSAANLIALCPTCHTRYDSHDITEKSIRYFKANLKMLSSKYNQIEMRVLESFAEQLVKRNYDADIWSKSFIAITMPPFSEVMYQALVTDQLVTEEYVPNAPKLGFSSEGDLCGVMNAGPILLKLTELGQKFVTKIARGQDTNSVFN
jgi:hypothetical protein